MSSASHPLPCGSGPVTCFDQLNIGESDTEQRHSMCSCSLFRSCFWGSATRRACPVAAPPELVEQKPRRGPPRSAELWWPHGPVSVGIGAPCQPLSWAGKAREKTAFANSALLNPREAAFTAPLKTSFHSSWHLFVNVLVYSASAF